MGLQFKPNFNCFCNSCSPYYSEIQDSNCPMSYDIKFIPPKIAWQQIYTDRVANIGLHCYDRILSICIYLYAPWCRI